MIMLRPLKMLIRSLWKHRLFTAINILSLTLCLTSVIVVLLLVSKLVTFDGFHQKGDRLFGLEQGDNKNPLSPGTVYPVAERLKADFPEIEGYTRTLTWDTYLLGYGQGTWSVTPDFVDPDFLMMFSFPLRYGNIKTALTDQNSLVLSAELALRIFGNINPIGKEISWNDSLSLKVSGVLEPLPGASSLQFTALMPMQWLYANTPSFRHMTTSWEDRFLTSYVLLKKGTNPSQFGMKLRQAALKYFPGQAKQPQLGLILFKDITPKYEPMLPYYVGGLRLIVCFLILIASVNLINLTSASAIYRIKEMGVRRILGSTKQHIVDLFLSETAVIASIALSISLMLAPPLIRYFNREVLTEFSVDFRWRQDFPVVLQVSLIFILLAFSAAWLPAKKLVKIPTALSLKGQITSLPKRNILQNSLIILQFTLASTFVLLTVVVQRQMHFLKHHHLGFDKSQVLVVDTYLGFKDRQKAYQTLDYALKNLSQFPAIEHVTASRDIPGQYRNWFNTFQSADHEVKCRVSWDLDSAYFPTYGIKLLAGYNFHDEKAAAQRQAIILNQTAAATLGWTPAQAIGQRLRTTDSERPEYYTVIGVSEDFHYRGLNQPIEPLAHFGNGTGEVSLLTGSPYMSIRVKPSKAKPVIQYLRQIISKIPATGNFTYSYSNEVFNKQYEREDMVMTLIAVAGVISIIVACAGTFGLIAQMTRMRTKEVGIRKVLGASSMQLVHLLSSKFMVLVGLSLILALPIGYWGASLWLQEFPYRIHISWWMLAITVIGVALIALSTVCTQAAKAAMANPVESLRNE